MLENRTIRKAVTNRVPEVYFIMPGMRTRTKEGARIAWPMLAKVNGKPYKIVADMPDTALVSHRELLNSMVSEVYDHVAKIKSGALNPELFPGEDVLPQLSREDLAAMQYSEIEDMMSDKPELLIT